MKLLNEHGIQPEIILYLVSPPTEKDLMKILRKIGIEAKELVRFKEGVASELGIKSSDQRTEVEWVRLMVENPVLIERPIVMTPQKAVIGRPPEKVLELIG